MSKRIPLWDRMLLGVVALVTMYALALVVAGLQVADSVFSRLGFGPGHGDITLDSGRDYLKLIYAVLGSVIVGWMLTLAAIIRGPLRRREPWAWKAVAAGVVSWFVLDTGISLTLNFAGHALFNIAFAVALAVPLAAIKTDLRTTTAPVASD